MARREENTGFACARCGAGVVPLTNGSYRNHCPRCLWSLHVDDVLPGDRASACRGLMEPIGIARNRKGRQVVHRCIRCGKVQPNRIAVDTDQPDDLHTLLEILGR